MNLRLPLALAALAALAAGCGQALGGGSSVAATGSPLCSTGTGAAFTPGTQAQTVASAPARARLLDAASDARWVVWTEDTAAGGVLCQYNFASQATVALAKGPIAAQGVATTSAGVWFVAANAGGGQSLHRIDHGGLRAPTVAPGISAPISGLGRYVAYANARGDTLQVAVLDTARRRGHERVLRQTMPRCQSGGDCFSIVAVQMLRHGVAWMSSPTTGSGQSVLSFAPLGGGAVVTDGVTADPTRGLVPSDGPVVYADPSGAWLSWQPGSTPQALTLPAGARPAAVAASTVYSVRVRGNDSTVTTLGAAGGTPLDATAPLTAKGQKGAVAAVVAGPAQICDLVNIYASASPPPGARPAHAYVRCLAAAAS